MKTILFIILIIWGIPSTFFRSKFRKIVYQTNDWKININDPKFGLEKQVPFENEHWDYQYWNRLTKGILKI